MKKKKIIAPSVFEKPTVGFSDLGGFFIQKKAVADIVNFCRDPRPFQKVGADVPRGLLLVGRSGMGKRVFAEALAREAGMKLLRVPSWVLTGTDEAVSDNINRCFDALVGKQPIMVLFEDIDRTAFSSDGNPVMIQQFIERFNAVSTSVPRFFIATVCTLDRAAMTLTEHQYLGGRIVSFDMPLRRERLEIIEMLAKKYPAISLNAENLSYLTNGMHFGQIQQLFAVAAGHAARNQSEHITEHEILEAYHEAKDGFRLAEVEDTKPLDRTLTAYHEAGHALVAHCHPFGQVVDHISIINRDQEYGSTVPLRGDFMPSYYGELMALLATSLAGYVVEEVVGKTSWRSRMSRGDLNYANSLASKMACAWGLGEKLGSRVKIDREENPVTDSLEAEHDIRKILATAEADARQILLKHKNKLTALAEALLKSDGILMGSEIIKILGPRPAAPKLRLP